MSSGCPYAAASASASAKQPNIGPMGCPMASRLQHHPQQEQHAAAGDAPTCPLGFGTSRGPKLTMLHCPVCRGLLFDAHMVNGCKHTFCKACIARTRDCPTCGRDVDGLQPNTELAGLVDTFLDTHSRSPELVAAAQADLGPLPDNTAASFFMAQGLKSMAGGNIHAALQRLNRCKQELLASDAAHKTAAAPAAGASSMDLGSNSSTSTAAADAGDAAAGASSDVQQQPGSLGMPMHADQHLKLRQNSLEVEESVVIKAVQLATVCGCLADCYQRLGQAGQAEQLLRESVAAVKPYSEVSAEAAHAMSVSLNKQGDARYMAQQLLVAKHLYKEALQLRQLCCGPLTAGRAGPEQQLELAASMLKVADVCKALGEADEGEQLMRRAYGVCCEVRSLEEGEPLQPPAARKLQLLLGMLQAQGHGLPGTSAAVADS